MRPATHQDGDDDDGNNDDEDDDDPNDNHDGEDDPGPNSPLLSLMLCACLGVAKEGGMTHSWVIPIPLPKDPH